MKRNTVLILALFLSALSSNEVPPPWPISVAESDEELSIALDAGGNKMAVWQENGTIMASELPLNGSWSIPLTLSDPTAAASSPQVEIDPSSGDATAMWLENGNMKAASKPSEGDWARARMSPAFVEEISDNAPSRKQLAIVLEPSETEGKKRKAPYPGAFAPPENALAAHSCSRKKGPKAEPPSSSRSLLFKPRPQKDGFECQGDDELENKRNSLSVNAIDAPSGGSLSGLHVGFAAGTAAPSNGAIVAGQMGVGTSSPGVAMLNLTSLTSTSIAIAAAIGGTPEGTTGLLSANDTVGISLAPILQPSGTISNSIYLYIYPQPNASLATSTTIPTSYGMYIHAGSLGSGTVTTAYGMYVRAPSFGTTKIAAYADNLATGYTGIAPPANGAIIEGSACIGASALIYTNQQFLVTSGTAGSTAVGGQFNGTLTNTASLGFGSAEQALVLYNGSLKCPASTTTNGILCGIETYITVDPSNASAVITNAASIAVGQGVVVSAGSGSSVTNGYGIYCNNPAFGTNKAAIYSDNLAVGYAGTSPPSGGAIISGQVGIGTSAATNPLTMGTVNSSSGELIKINGTSAQSYISFYNNTTRQGYIGTNASGAGLILNADQTSLVLQTSSIPIYMTGMSVVGINGGLSVGASYYSTLPPTNGAIIQGQVAIGNNAAGTGARLYVAQAATDTTCLALGGNAMTSVDGSNNQYGLTVYNQFDPTLGSGVSRAVDIAPLFIAPSTKAIGQAACIHIYPNYSANVGTITAGYGMYIEAGSSGAGTITTAYALRVDPPTAASTNICAAFNGGISIGSGYTGITPPSEGAIVQGYLGVGSSGPQAPIQISAAPGSAGQGMLHIRPASGNSGYITWTENSVADRGYIGFTNGSGTMNFGVGGLVTTGTTWMVMTSAGLVGIGNTAPTSNVRLNVTAQTTDVAGIYINGTSNAQASARAWGLLIEETLNPTGGTASYIAGAAIDPTLIAPSGDTVFLATGIYTDPTWSSNVGTITEACGIYIDTGSSGAGTITRAYGLYCNAPTAASTNIATYTDNLSVGYTGTSPPSSGAIISGVVGIGTNSPTTGSNLTITKGTSDNNSLYLNGTSTTSSLNYEYLSEGTLTSSSNPGNEQAFIALMGAHVAGSGHTISEADGLLVSLGWNSNVGTIEAAINCRISALSSGSGTITTGWGLYVDAPVMASTNYTAQFGGSKSDIVIDSQGNVYPATSNQVSLGRSGNVWTTVWTKGGVSTGTSRLARSKTTCSTCNKTMMRGTGTLSILGETADYIPCWCCNDLCRNKGNMVMEAIQHLPPSKLALRRPPPKIEFIGFVVKATGGHSYSIFVEFKYVDAKSDTLDPKKAAIINSTLFSDVELAEYLSLNEDEQHDYLYKLGLREWNALEEARLMREEAAELESKLNTMTKKWIQTDLMQ